MLKTFRYRLYPTPAQATTMQHTLNECRWLYNHLLEQRKTVWDERGETLGYYDQNVTIPPLKAERPTLKDVHSQVLQDVAVRLDLVFKAFFRRVKAGEQPGYPRFRGRGQYDSFCYPQSGYKLDGQRVFLSKIGHVKTVIHRPIGGTVKTCCVRRTATGKWFATLSCAMEDAPLPAMDSAIGIDVGLASFATLSDGAEVANPRFFRRGGWRRNRARRKDSAPRPRVGAAGSWSPASMSASPIGARTLPISRAAASSTRTTRSRSRTSRSTAWSTTTALPSPSPMRRGPCSPRTCRTRLQAPVAGSSPSTPPIPVKIAAGAAIVRN